MIKNIEELKNIQIVCRNQEQVKNCLNYLKQLGFDVDYYDCENYLIVFYDTSFDGFLTSYELEKKFIKFYNKELVKTLQKFIKQKEEKEKLKDYEVARDGRIIKINNKKSEKKIFVTDEYFDGGKTICLLSQKYIDYVLKYGLAYATIEARDKAMFKLEIETKLKDIAETINAGRKIDWEDRDQNKYEIYYDYTRKKIECRAFCYCKDQGIIYCLDQSFLKVAKQEIGEENLIKYFEE